MLTRKTTPSARGAPYPPLGANPRRPSSSITGFGALLGLLFPMTYFLPISVGTFTKGLGLADLSGQLLAGVRAGIDPAQPRADARAGEVTAVRTLSTIFWLATKELRSFLRDWVLFGLVVYSFSLAIIAQAQGNTLELHNASIGIVDEDRSELSRRIARAFLPPHFRPAEPVELKDVDRLMDKGATHLCFSGIESRRVTS